MTKYVKGRWKERMSKEKETKEGMMEKEEENEETKEKRKVHYTE
jgi:hypothetical protein